MLKKFTKLLSLGVSIVMLASLSACGSKVAAPTPAAKSSDSAPVTYKVRWAYSTPDEKGPMDYAIAKMKTVMPNVSFEIEPQLNDNGESLKTRIATGDLPDIFGIQPGMLDAAINSKSILNLDDALVSTGYKDKLTPMSLANQVKYTDGHCWAFPVTGTSVDLLFYNKDVFAQNNVKVPTNYDELLTAVKAFSAKKIVSIPLDGKEAWPIGAYFDMFADRVNQEGMLALSKGTAKASDPGYKDAITKMAALIKAGVFQKGATSTDYDAARAIFHTGKAPMLINGEWDLGEIATQLGDKADFLDVFPTTDPGKEDANRYTMPGASELGGFAVSSKTKNPAQAEKIAALLSQYCSEGGFIKEGRTDMAVKVDGLTPDKPLSALALKLIKAKENYVVKGTVEHSIPNKVFSTGFGELLQKLIVGESPDAFISDTNKLYDSTK